LRRALRFPLPPPLPVSANFANNILALAASGAKIIVDDIIYYAETAYQDGPIAQAINQVTANGAIYFSAAGNDGDNGFESSFTASGVLGSFGESLAKLTTGGSPQFLPITVPGHATVTVVLQWNQPAASVSGAVNSQSDVDLFLTIPRGP
jgi:subtilisin family serine protease